MHELQQVIKVIWNCWQVAAKSRIKYLTKETLGQSGLSLIALVVTIIPPIRLLAGIAYNNLLWVFTSYSWKAHIIPYLVHVQTNTNLPIDQGEVMWGTKHQTGNNQNNNQKTENKAWCGLARCLSFQIMSSSVIRCKEHVNKTIQRVNKKNITYYKW